MFVKVIAPFRRSSIAALAVFATIAGAGAATAHRFAVSSGTGSEGAFSYNNSSASGSALQGTVSSSAVTSITIPFGVLGNYTNSSTFGIGVAGISVSGYGVGAETFGANPSLIAIQNGNADAADVYDDASTGNGLLASAKGGHGVVGMTSASGFDGVFASNSAAGDNAQLATGSGSGIATFGSSGTETTASVAAYTIKENSAVFSGSAYDSGTGNVLENAVLTGTSAGRSGVASNGSDLQIYGDIYVVGRVYQSCNAFAIPIASGTACEDVTSSTSPTTSGVARESDGRSVSTYAAKQSLPTVEDFGNARLSGGNAYVRLDPTFAQTMSTRTPYHVFITPDGESRGLYVTQKTSEGFVVRENAQGRSSLDFDYRIVASPLGEPSQRFPAVAQRRPLGQRRGIRIDSVAGPAMRAPAYRDLAVARNASAAKH